nr:hypothetical protein [Tanacetum cinerariifolium]
MKKSGQIERQEEASKADLAEMYDEVQEQIDADHELAVRLTLEQKVKYTVKKRSKLSVEFFKRRKKQLAKERAEAIRSKPPIKTQLKNLMLTYLKHTSSDKEHRKCLKVVPDDGKPLDCETLDVKNPIVGFLDRQDVLDLHKIIMERFPANDLKGYDLILWGDLKTLVESSEDDEIWRNQQD